ncbi:putative ACT domain-containing protein ACR1-12 [Helianthus anomalus]
MVQVLTDLDLVISKSYICSDGRWFMNVFHVNDQLGNKITDKNLIHYIQQSICTSRRGKTQVKTRTGGKEKHTTLEMTTIDRPGLLSEISAVLAELQCHVSAAVAWTHKTRAACIIQVEDDANHGSIMDPKKVDRVQAQLMTVVNAHHINHHQPNVRITCLTTGPTHTERRLHQLMMMADKDYEEGTFSSTHETSVTVENCREKGYSVLNVTCPDRPKLLFDTVCTLTDMQYVVFHATVCSKGSVAFQEYYIRQNDGQTLTSETQRQAITRCITAAVERRVSHVNSIYIQNLSMTYTYNLYLLYVYAQGLRLDVRSRNRSGLLSDVTRVFRENGLSIARAEIRIHGENAFGSFHVTDAAGGHNVDPVMIGSVKKEMEKFNGVVVASNVSSSSNTNTDEDQTRSSSLATLLWSQLEKLSSKFQTRKL